MPKTSILIPTYNNSKALERAVESCLIQDYSDYEIIITDDSTNRDSQDLYRKLWQNNPKIKYFHNEVPLGSPKNWNYAISKASGDYIKFLHHDDWFTNSSSLKKLVNALDNNPASDFAYCQSQDINENNKIRLHDFSDKVDLIKSDIYTLWPDNFVGAPSATIYKNCELLFDENLKWLVDLDFYIRILQKNPNFVYIPDICVNIGISSGQVTQSCINNSEVELFENFYVYEKYRQYFRNKKEKLKILKYILKKYKQNKSMLYIKKYYTWLITNFFKL